MHMKAKKIAVCSTILILSAFFVLACSVFADVPDEERAKEILLTFPLEMNSYIGYIGRQLGWLLSLGLCSIVSALEGSIYQINTVMSSFIQSDGVQALTSTFMQPIVLTLFVIVIAIIGINFMINGRARPEIVQNLIIGLMVFVALPTCVVGISSATTSAMEYVQTFNGNLQVGDKLIRSNTTDNLLYEEQGFESSTVSAVDNEGNRNRITNISQIDPCELIKPDSTSTYGIVWSNKIKNDVNGNPELVANEGVWKIFNNEMPDFFAKCYYRWNIDFFTIDVSAIIMIVALLFTAVKVARLLYEVVIHQLLANVLAFIDIQSGQRLKKCLQSILSTFATLFLCTLMFQFFIIAEAYISNYCKSQGGGLEWTFVYIICMLALAWSLIDGPNLIEQIVGVDAGLHGALRTVYGLKTAGNVAKGITGSVIGRKGANGERYGGAVGTVKGVANKFSGHFQSDTGGGNSGSIGGIGSGIDTGQTDNLYSENGGNHTDNSGINGSAFSSDNSSSQGSVSSNNQGADYSVSGASMPKSDNGGYRGIYTEDKQNNSNDGGLYNGVKAVSNGTNQMGKSSINSGIKGNYNNTDNEPDFIHNGGVYGQENISDNSPISRENGNPYNNNTKPLGRRNDDIFKSNIGNKKEEKNGNFIHDTTKIKRGD